MCGSWQVAAVAATHGQLAGRIALVEGERHLASSLCQTFHSRLLALQQINKDLALEVTHLEQSLAQVRHAVFLCLKEGIDTSRVYMQSCGTQGHLLQH